MALSSDKKTKFKPILQASVRARVSQKKGVHFNIEERILKCDFNSLSPMAQRQILSHYKKLRRHPHMRIYVKLINLVILDDKLFRNLFCLKISNKKSEEENE